MSHELHDRARIDVVGDKIGGKFVPQPVGVKLNANELTDTPDLIVDTIYCPHSAIAPSK